MLVHQNQDLGSKMLLHQNWELMNQVTMWFKVDNGDYLQFEG
jgi:hypothetical protein